MGIEDTLQTIVESINDTNEMVKNYICYHCANKNDADFRCDYCYNCDRFEDMRGEDDE